MGSSYFGTTDLNNGAYTPDPVSLTYPDLPLTKMRRHGTIDDFSTLVLRGMKIYQEKFLKKARATWVPLVMGYPMTKMKDSSKIQFENIQTLDDYYYLYPFCNVITFTMRFQAPAGYRRPFGSEKMRAPMHKEDLRVNEHPGTIYGVETHEMDNLVQFDCWSSTGRGADGLVDWFKKYMEFFKGSIMMQGFQKIQFWERGIDKDVIKWRDDISVRSLQYLVKSEEHYLLPQRLISEIDLEMKVDRNLTEEQKVFFDAVVEGIPPSGLLTADVDTGPLISGLNEVSTTTLIEH
jgi:hypothetical protein